MTTIAAAVSLAPRDTRVRQFPRPQIDADAGLLHVELTGVCGSDWPYYLRYPQSKGPLILGHETVGRIEEVGAIAARRFGVKEGDRVALEEYLPCGHCRWCRSGDFRLCDETDTLNRPGTIRFGSTPISVPPALWGGYAQAKYLHPNSVFHRVPDHVAAKLATLALPLGNGVEWAVLQGSGQGRRSRRHPGAGQQGLACTVMAREAGAGARDRDWTRHADRQEAARTCRSGSARITPSTSTARIYLERVADLTGGEMADLVMDCSSGGSKAVLAALQLARKRGRVILGGRAGGSIPEFDPDVLVKKVLTVKGVRGHSFEAVELAMQVIAIGQAIPLEDMCTHVFPLAETDLALRTVGGEGQPDAIHCAVDPWA